MIAYKTKKDTLAGVFFIRIIIYLSGDYMKLSDLQNKDVVDIITGEKIGNIIDVVITKKGEISKLILEEKRVTRKIFNNNNEILKKELFILDILIFYIVIITSQLLFDHIIHTSPLSFILNYISLISH